MPAHGVTENRYLHSDAGDVDIVNAGFASPPGLAPVLGPQEVFDGDGSDDNHTGTSGDDTINGNGGSDTLLGGDGNDTLNGGDGDDSLWAGTGIDTLNGSAGDDVFRIDTADWISAGEHFTGGTGIDTIQIDAHSHDPADLTGAIVDSDVERLVSPNTLTSVTAEQFNAFDEVQGGQRFVETGTYDFTGNKGLGGFLQLADGTNMVTLAGNSAAYTIDGGGGADTMIGSEGIDTLRGWGGNDVIEGRGGNDLLGGGDGDDTIRGGDGNDSIVGNGGTNLLEGGAGDDYIRIDTDVIGGGSWASGGSGYDKLAFNGNGNFGVSVNIDIPNIANDFEELAAQGEVVHMSAAQYTTFTLKVANALWITTAGDLGTLNPSDEYLTLVFSDLGNTLTLTAASAPHVGAIYGGAGIDTINLVLSAPAVFTLPIAVENLNVTGASIEAHGNAQANTITGDDTSQTLYGGDGDDTLLGMGGDDTLVGEGGNDTLDGGTGADQLVGGTGNDAYLVDRQDDMVYENAGEGIDTVTSTANYYLYANIEKLTLAAGAGDLFGVGNDSDNTIAGNEGANVLLGGAGDDTIHGNAGNDQIYGEGGNDQLYGDAGTDYLIGGDGDDVLDGGADEDALYGGDGEDTLWGGSDFKTDTMTGGAGNDVIHADSGKGDYDLLDGGADNDSYYVDTYADATYEAAGAAGGYDTVYADISGSGYYLYANVEKLVLLGDTAFGVGNDLDNVITGSTSANFLLGGGGADQINGGDGNDSLYGEAGNDTLNGESGNDVVSGGDGNDDIQGYVGDDILYGDAGNDRIDAGHGHDVISGGAGDDVIIGSSDGGNTLYGDDGNDEIYTTNSYGNLVVAGAGDDIIHAGGGFDNLYGGSGDDIYYVGIAVYYDGPGFTVRHESSDAVFEDSDGGNDTVYVSVSGAVDSTAPVYYMTANVENLVLAGEDATSAVGNDLANSMIGSASKDLLLGGAGDDVLNGKANDDTLWGEAGADHFVFEQGSGKDTVGDFTAGTDKIDLSAFHLSSFDDVAAAMHETDGTTTIDLGGGVLVVLQGVAKASLHEGDFILSGGTTASAPTVEQRTARAMDDTLAGWHATLIHQLDVPVTHFAFGGF